jgi:uncharacterized repeat protein (TIGR01451 family)
MVTKNDRRSGVLRGVAAALVAAGVAFSAQGAFMVHEFYLPLPEAQIRSSFVSLSSASAVGTTMEAVFSIVVTGPGTIIHYDHWEDGYEVDINNPLQSTTQIWGDGNDANGIAPGFTKDPSGLPMGTVIALRNQMSLPRNPGTRLYDARDRVTATKALVISRAAWSTKIGTLLSSSVEVQATIDHGTRFLAPVGQDVNASSMFEYVGLFVMADTDNTAVTIDTDGAGPKAPLSVTLNRGESYHVDGGIMKGASVTATKPVQAHLVTGDIGGNYEARWFTLYPVEDWYNSYVTPVGTAANGHECYLFVYNPGPAAITIQARSRTGAVSFTVQPGAAYQWQVPQNSGAILTSAGGEPFCAVSTVGAKPSSNNVHDWGFALVPADALTTEVVVGWGPGSSDLSKNGSPVWVTAEAATKIYVDYNGDKNGPLTDPNGNKYDVAYDLAALESRTIFDPDRDQTAMRIYTVDGVRLTAAWGQDPATAGAVNPFLDMGTSVLPFPVPVIHKSSTLKVDNGLPGLSLGDILEYRIAVDNRGLLPLGNTLVLDQLPPQLEYVANSSTRGGEPLADDATGATVFPLDESGYTIPVILRGGTSVFTYQVQIVASGSILNTAANPQYQLVSDNTVVVQPPAGSNPSTIAFIDASGTPVPVYPADGDVYLRLTDADANTDPNTAEIITVYVKNETTGDIEKITLTETGPNTGVFVNTSPLPSAGSGGLGMEDGTLYARPGDTLSVFYQDPIYGDSCSTTAMIGVVSAIKPLYLTTDGGDNDATGALDRIDPVAAGDATISQTEPLTMTTVAPTSAVITVVGTAASSTSSQTATSHSFFYNSGTAGDNRILMVGISYRNNDSETVSSVTYGGQAMTSVGTANNSTSGRIYIYQLVNPPTDNNSLAVTWNSALNNYAVVGAVTYAGVDPATPLGAFNSITGDSNTPSVTVASGSGEVVFGVVGGRSTSVYTLSGSGGTSLWSVRPSSGNTAGSGQSKPGIASTAVSWSGSSAQWAAGGVSLKPALIGGSGVVAVDNASSGSGNTASLVISHTTGTGADRLMLVGVSISAYTSGSQVTGITYGSQALTLVRTNLLTETGNFNPRTEIWQLVNPNPGTANVTIQLSTSRILTAGVTTFSGVDQTNPLASTNAANGSSTSASVTVSGGDLYYGVVCASKASPSPTLTDGAGQTRQWHLSLNNGNSYMTGAGAVKTSNGALSWTSSASAPWSACAVAIRSAGVGNGVAFMQTPALAAPLSLPAGGIVAITNFVNVTSGTMPAAPAVTATLSAGGTPFLTLDNPVYSNGALVWSGVLGNTVNIPAGEAVALSVSNRQSGVAYRIRYDSATYPSKVLLPVTTIISVDSLGVYDAPYPGGVPVASVAAGATVYVRATVSDPFGAYDITGLDLSIPTAGVGVALDDGAVVASTAGSKTYEYAWKTAATTNHTISVTAHEGSEGIADAAATTLDVTFLDTGSPGIVEFTVTDNGSRTNRYAPDQLVYVRVTDMDENKDPNAIETVTVVITTASGDKETVVLTETGPNTGIFTAEVPASSTTDGGDEDGTLYLPPGTQLAVEYTDPDDPADHSSDNAVVPLPAATPGVSVVKTRLLPADGVALVGDPVRFAIRVTNIGDTTLSGVALADAYPAAALTYTGAVPGPTDAGAGTLSWSNVGPLSPGQDKTVIVDFTAAAPASMATNTATVNAGGGLTGSSSATVTIIKPEVTVSKVILSPVPGPATVGELVEYEVVVANTGTTPITTLPLEDTFSAAYLAYESATIQPDGVGAGSLFWENLAAAGALMPGRAITNQITLRVVGGGNPAVNHANVDYAVDAYGNDVPPAHGEASLVTLAAAITGRVWNDANTNAAADAGETGIAGVTLQLYTDPNGDGDPSDGVLVQVTTTVDTNGYYEFVNLGAGQYVVVQSDLAGYGSTGDTQGANDNRIAVHVTESGSYADNDFFDYLIPPASYASLSGKVWDDANLSATNELGEAGLGGVSVQLVSDVNGNGVADPGEPVVAVTMTDTNGLFTFTGLEAGKYVIVENDPPGFSSTGDVAGANDNQVGVSVAAGENRIGLDFFDARRVTAIGNRVWEDLNGNGIQDADEPGLAGIEIRLYNASDTLLGTVITDADGAYAFTNLLPGTYHVQAVAPAGYQATLKGAGDNPELDSDMGVGGRSDPITVGPWDIRTDMDFGLYRPAVVKGYVFKDNNGNLLRDAGDSTITNALVRLVHNGVVIASTTTDANGYYRFEQVPPGPVSVLVSRVDATLIGVPENGDERRNRAVPDEDGVDAVIVYTVQPGDDGSETLNFGFATYPLSAAIDIRLRAAAGGGVTIDIWTVDESGYGDIVIFAWVGNDWVEVGRVPSREILGEGSNRYTVAAEGLAFGGAYFLKVIDEAGHVHFSPTPVAVDALRVEAMRLEMQTLTMSFNTTPGRSYVVEVSTDLVTWSREVVSAPTAAGWSAYSSESFTAGPGERTQVRVPVNGRQRAFFRIKQTE